MLDVGWTNNAITNAAIKSSMERILSEADQGKRWRIALGEIASAAALYDFPKMASCLSVMAMCALHPDDYRQDHAKSADTEAIDDNEGSDCD